MSKCFKCMEEVGDVSVCPFCGYDRETTVDKLDNISHGTLLNERYLIGNPLGRGGFGITYIAYDEEMCRKVAIKEYLPKEYASRPAGEMAVSCYEESEKFFHKGVEKTIEEGTRLARFTGNENIVAVFDCFKENETAYIVMEFLEGENAKERLKKTGKFSYEETVKIITPILKALGETHKINLIHRDISPDNIFLCNDGTVKLIDFGSARISNTDEEKSLSVVLKHGYAPVEQYTSKGKQGPWTDVYAVGATMYKMLTGITPQESIERLGSGDELKDISELADIPETVAAAIMKSMSIFAKNRPQTAEEMLRLLNFCENSSDETVTVPEMKIKTPDTEETVTILSKAYENSEYSEKQKDVQAGSDNNCGKENQKTDSKHNNKRVILFALLFMFAIVIVFIASSLLTKREKSELKQTSSSVPSSLTTNSAELSQSSTTEIETTIYSEKYMNTNPGDIIPFGSYEQDADLDDGKEPIEWCVLDKKDGKLFVISKHIIDFVPFDMYDENYTWETCTLRNWLNSTFVDESFETDEQNIIQSTVVINKDNEEYGTEGGNNTTDKIFILSTEEVEKYFNSQYERICKPTKYAASTLEYYGYRLGVLESGEWYLRSVGRYLGEVCGVGNTGIVSDSCSLDRVNYGIRPAMWIKV